MSCPRAQRVRPPARRLAAAWAKAYALNPDPSGAYSDAVRAVEDVAIPKFLLNDPSASLGKVISHLTDAALKYELVIQGKDATQAGIEPVTAMAKLLWEGHRDRHLGGKTSALWKRRRLPSTWRRHSCSG